MANSREWSEKAIRAGHDAYWGALSQGKQSDDGMRAALDAAAAVDGDAQWNAAIEEAAKKMFSVPLDGVPLLAQHKVSARDMEIAASIRSLKRLK